MITRLNFAQRDFVKAEAEAEAEDETEAPAEAQCYYEESFTIQVRERNPLLSKSERGILYYPSPREESFTIQVRVRTMIMMIVFISSR